MRLSWPDWATNFVLQTSEALAPAVTWPEAGGTPATTNGESVVTLPVPDQTKFYRLFQKRLQCRQQRRAPPGINLFSAIEVVGEGGLSQ